MDPKRNLIIILLITIFQAGLLSGCNLSKIKIGEVRMMYGSNEEGRIAYNIRSFTGVESGSVQATKGQTIPFSYRVILDQGSLLIEWQDPEGEVMWQEVLAESGSGGAEISILFPGEYVIIVQGNGFSGNIDVSWDIK